MNSDGISSEILYQFLILKTLVDIGGSARRDRVLNHIKLHYNNFLSKKDLEDYESDNGERWKNHASFARQHLIYVGYLARNSPYGIWEITDVGRSKCAEWIKLLKQDLTHSGL
ncbi:MAG: winged helix-turn-helix domain-containing protein [Candidatus Omnitrophota bacterium]